VYGSYRDLARTAALDIARHQNELVRAIRNGDWAAATHQANVVEIVARRAAEAASLCPLEVRLRFGGEDATGRALPLAIPLALPGVGHGG
jgi:hypothetical protein